VVGCRHFITQGDLIPDEESKIAAQKQREAEAANPEPELPDEELPAFLTKTEKPLFGQPPQARFLTPASRPPPPAPIRSLPFGTPSDVIVID